jgi:hypothetical protein
MYDSLAAYWEFRGLSAEECSEFVIQRLKGAGASPNIIDNSVMDHLYGLCGKGNFRELGSLMRDALLIVDTGREKCDRNERHAFCIKVQRAVKHFFGKRY